MTSVIHTIAITVSFIGIVLGYGYIIIRVVYEFTRDKRREKTRKKSLDVFLEKRKKRHEND